jgi:hypothetical protein
MKTDAAKSWFDLGVMLVLLAALIFMSGCKGGLFGGSHSPDVGTPPIIVYNTINHPGSRSITNNANTGTLSPMYQAPEGEVEAAPAAGTAYVTEPQMPASGAQNAGTQANKFGIQVINDGVKRTAETDLSAAAQLMAGNTQSNAGQTPATAQRQGTATPTATQTANPEHNPALQVNPATALTGQGTAQVTNPTSTLAGASSQPGAVTGGSGTGTATSGDRTDTTDRTDLTDRESVTAVTANADGTKTVTTASGKTMTGKAMGPFQSGTETVWVLLLADGTAVRLNATGANATALGQ